MNSSPFLRLLTAAGMYLLLIWGYIALPSAQLFAAFTALVMSAALFLWGSAAQKQEQTSDFDADTPLPNSFSAVESEQRFTDSASSDAASDKLDALKEDLTKQYAEFGRDQARLNINGLGTWHQQASADGSAKRNWGQ